MSALIDGHGRAVRYLRLSLTERCNLACSYCVPEHHDALPSDWLTDDEIVALVAALRPLGLDHLRLTGGEPTLRPRLPRLVSRLAALGIADLALTTNATRLTDLARPLHEAGLHRVNVSLDTLDPDAFRALTGAELEPVLGGIDALADAGFSHGKLNVVLLRGVNDGQLASLARFAWRRGLVPRFIELMPMSDGRVAPPSRFLPVAAARRELEAALGPLVAKEHDLRGAGPARYLSTSDGPVGFISAVTEPFCETCNRIRVSARGRLHACLGIDDVVTAPDPLDLRAALRRGVDATRDAVRAALAKKGRGHAFDRCDTDRGGPRRHMVVIGG